MLIFLEWTKQFQSKSFCLWSEKPLYRESSSSCPDPGWWYQEHCAWIATKLHCHWCLKIPLWKSSKILHYATSFQLFHFKKKNTIVKNCPEKLKSRKFRKSCCEISIVWWPESKGRCQLMFYRTSTQNDLRVPRKFLRFSLKLIRSMLTVCKIEYTVHWYSNDLLHNSSY